MFLFLYYFYTVYGDCQLRSFTSYVEKSKKKKEERAVSVSQKLTRCLACL